MALVLARLLYGFSLSWMVAGVLVAATLLCIRLIGIAVVAFEDERSGNIAGAACVAVVVCAALACMVWSGYWLHDALGTSPLVAGRTRWLAGGNTLSPAAIFGALAGCGVLAALRNVVLRSPRNAEEGGKAGKPSDPKAAAAHKASKGSTAAKGRGTAAASRKAAAAVREPRIPALGWSALFLLLLGGALFAFAYGVDPLWIPRNTAASAAKQFVDMAGRARPVYLVAAGLEGAGVLLGLLWLVWRRKAD